MSVPCIQYMSVWDEGVVSCDIDGIYMISLRVECILNISYAMTPGVVKLSLSVYDTTQGWATHNWVSYAMTPGVVKQELNAYDVTQGWATHNWMLNAGRLTVIYDQLVSLLATAFGLYGL